LTSPYSDYMEWAKTRSKARFNLASSGLATYPLAELAPGPDALRIEDSYYGFPPLLDGQPNVAAKTLLHPVFRGQSKQPRNALFLCPSDLPPGTA